MPSHVRIFFWLGMAAVLYGILSAAWVLTFPAPETLALMAKLPPAFRDVMQQAVVRQLVFATAVWTVVQSALLWLAAFRRQNWARWGYAALFVLRKLMPFATALASRDFGRHLSGYVARDWSNPLAYLWTLLVLAAIAFAFTGNARDWFRPAMPRAAAA